MNAPRMRAGGELLIHGELVLMGAVGDPFDGFDAMGTRRALAIHGNGDVTVRLNSGRGDPFEGAAIMAALQEHPGRVSVRVEGLAASAASLLAMGADEIVMGPAALLMIHDPSAITLGPADAHRRTAETLDKLADTYATAYARRSGLDPARVRELMAAETWMDGAEAVALGFADRADDGDPADAPAPAAGRMLQQFRHTPPALLARQERVGGPPVAADRTKEANVPDTITQPAPPAAPAVQPAEPDHAAQLRKMGAKLEIPGERVEQLLAAGVTLEAGREALMDEWAARGDQHEYGARPAEPRPGFDMRDRLIAGMAAWLKGEDPRAGAAITPTMAAFEVCRMNRLRAWDGAEAVRMAASHTSGDFPLILEGAVGNDVARRLEQRLPDLARASHEVARNDYRAANLLGLSASAAPEAVSEGGEIKHVSIDETGEALPQLEDYASLFAISEKALVNDSTSAGLFDQLGAKMVEGAVERLRAELIRPLEANSGAGQTMRDGNPVFDASRGNVAASGAALSVTSLSNARLAMRTQKGPKGEEAVDELGPDVPRVE
ncbi:MAG: Clp protease ClpP [Paracoccaceae bacterium]